MYVIIYPFPMNIDRLRFGRELVVGTIIATGSMALFGCGGQNASSGESATTTTEANILDLSVSQDPAVENYSLTQVSTFYVNADGVQQDVATYQEEYDFNGLHWDCSLSVSDGNKSGGVAKSCETTPLS